MKRLLGGGVLGAVLVAVACNDSGHGLDCTDFGDGISSCLERAEAEGEGDGDGGRDGDATIDVPPGCDLTKSVKDAPACVDDAVGIFVSPAGNDGADGTKSAPVRSIRRGVELATSRQRPRVYVCEGNYGDAIEITSAVEIVGELSCSWDVGAGKPRIVPPAGIALRVTDVGGPVLIEGLAIVGSANSTKPGDSAIAAFVSGAGNVTFRNTDLTANDGVGVAPGTGGSNYMAAAKDGIGAASGAGAVTCACLDGTTNSTGGKGGPLGGGGDPGSASPAVGGVNSGLGGVTCTPGTVGASGVATPGGGAGGSAGTLTQSGWAGAVDATAGGTGNPGQGGGGGGGRNGVTAGGGGACGGCGGAGGRPGASGGSSIALLSFESTITVDGGALKTGKAGAGGEGGSGQDGQAGGSGGVGACDGGPGGSGAGGSGGGGGAGGHSVPVAFAGTEPRIVNATLTPGTEGTGGEGGKAGAGPGTAGNAGAKGASGKAQRTLAL